MTIPFATSSITITRTNLSDTQDPYDPPADYPDPPSDTIATGVRAVITVPGGNTALIAGQRVVFDTQITLDPCDLQAGDTMTDEGTGVIWVCLNATPFGAFGISGTKASARRVTGFGQ